MSCENEELSKLGPELLRLHQYFHERAASHARSMNKLKTYSLSNRPSATQVDYYGAAKHEERAQLLANELAGRNINSS